VTTGANRSPGWVDPAAFRLERGDRVAVVAPSGPLRPEALEAGIAVLRRRGFDVVVGEHVRDRCAYLAGTDEDRTADFNRALRDPSVRALWLARGGYGLPRILDRLDLGRLVDDPKILIGYSDATALFSAVLRDTPARVLHGPMVGTLADRRAYHAPSLWRALSGAPMEYRLTRGAVHRAGIAEGPVVGGCLSLLAAVAGTPYEPPVDGAILFWEDVNEEPFRIDRMLAQLRHAGWLRRIRGLIVGRLHNVRARTRVYDVPLRDLLEAHLAGTDYPVVTGFPAGHAPGQRALPLGVAARLDTKAGRLEVGSAATRSAREISAR
jgi:muramoyltetrapeptide carboxypeptidase